MNPTFAKKLVAAAAICAAVAGCTGKPDGVEPVRGFDVTRYGGEWFEVMRLDHRFERGLTNVTATYTLRPDGTIDVVNKGLDRSTCRWKAAVGRTEFQGEPNVASLSVTFFWPFAGGYHVVDLDRQDYGWALVSGPSRGYLWILARKPDLESDTVRRLVAHAQRLGFPVDELILVEHESSTCPDFGSR
jgi:apolipoprotein D and lipocalin family protein